jgi:hypothetical protein
MDDIPVSAPLDAEDKAGRRTILVISLALAGLCCCGFLAGAFFFLRPDPQALIAQYFPSSTVTASPTLPPTPTQPATATSTSTPTPDLTATEEMLQGTDIAQSALGTVTNAVDSWRVVMTDTFDSNKNDWLNEESEDEFAKVNYQIIDGKYKWDVLTKKSFIGWVRAGSKSFGDFFVSFDIQQVSGPSTADAGVVFREDNDGNFYYFGINNNGEYMLYKYAGEWTTLIDLTETDLIQVNEPNRITVIGEGSQFTFFINDQYLTSITDEHISKGNVALAVEMLDENDEGIFEFDNLELRAP